jgi:hypothetical protein
MTDFREERTNAEIYSRARRKSISFRRNLGMHPNRGTETEKEDLLLQLSYGICNGGSTN